MGRLVVDIGTLVREQASVVSYRIKTKRTVRRGHITNLVNKVTAALPNESVTEDTLSGLLERLLTSNDELKRLNQEME